MRLGYSGTLSPSYRELMMALRRHELLYQVVEVEPLANIRDVDVKRFIWRNIITRFEVPYTLILDNGLQFDSKTF